MKNYFNVRVIEAENHENAIEKVERGEFIETHPLSDKVSRACLMGRDFHKRVIWLNSEDALEILTDENEDAINNALTKFVQTEDYKNGTWDEDTLTKFLYDENLNFLVIPHEREEMEITSF
jgi:hypothetical protein